jgi:mRNA (guanine-N7-)-methyltransferase
MASSESSSAAAVEAHYDRIASGFVGRGSRSALDCVQLRHLNNWIKLVQINRFVPNGAYVFDICSGKGGDLMKYMRRRIGYYVGADLSKRSVQEAMQRYNNLRDARFQATFIHADCTQVALGLLRVVHTHPLQPIS